jgi:hypothetical protein
MQKQLYIKNQKGENRKREMERCQVGQSRGIGKEKWRDVR